MSVRSRWPRSHSSCRSLGVRAAARACCHGCRTRPRIGRAPAVLAAVARRHERARRGALVLQCQRVFGGAITAATAAIVARSPQSSTGLAATGSAVNGSSGAGTAGTAGSLARATGGVLGASGRLGGCRAAQAIGRRAARAVARNAEIRMPTSITPARGAIGSCKRAGAAGPTPSENDIEEHREDDQVAKSARGPSRRRTGRAGPRTSRGRALHRRRGGIPETMAVRPSTPRILSGHGRGRQGPAPRLATAGGPA